MNARPIRKGTPTGEGKEEEEEEEVDWKGRKGTIHEQMEEITENHPNSEEEGEQIPIITQRDKEGDRVNKFGSRLNRRPTP